MPATILGRNVFAALKRLGWTQNDLATKMGLSHAYVSRIIGGNSWVSGKVLTKLSEALGISYSDLLDDPNRLQTVPQKSQITIAEALRVINGYRGLLNIKIRSNEKLAETDLAFQMPHKPELLFLDTKPKMRDKYKRGLSSIGYEVTFVSLPREAWGIMTTKQFVVLVVDCTKNRLLNYRLLELVADYNPKICRIQIDDDNVPNDTLDITRPHGMIRVPYNRKTLIEGVLNGVERFRGVKKVESKAPTGTNQVP